MDYETIDSFKQSRLELFFSLFCYNDFKFRNKGQAIGVQQLVTTLAVAGILMVIGVTVFQAVIKEVSTTSGTDAANTTIAELVNTSAINGLELGIIGVVVLGAVIIMVVLFTLKNAADTDDEDFVSMKQLKKKEKKHNLQMIDESQYDDAKKPRWNLFGLNKNKGLKK